MAKHLARKDKSEEDKAAFNIRRRKDLVHKEIRVREKEAKSNTSPKDKAEETMSRLEKVAADNINRKVLAVQKITRIRSPTKNMVKMVDRRYRITRRARAKVDIRTRTTVAVE